MGTRRVSLRVNGVPQEAEVEPRTLLVYFLREGLGLSGTKVGCDTSSCGTCTVLVQADGREITTIEGVAEGGELHPLQRAFQENHGLQCGFCTPGMVMAALGYLQKNPSPSEESVRHALEGNLCRCTGYTNIVRSILAAAPAMNGHAAAEVGAPGG